MFSSVHLIAIQCCDSELGLVSFAFISLQFPEKNVWKSQRSFITQRSVMHLVFAAQAPTWGRFVIKRCEEYFLCVWLQNHVLRFCVLQERRSCSTVRFLWSLSLRTKCISVWWVPLSCARTQLPDSKDAKNFTLYHFSSLHLLTFLLRTKFGQLKKNWVLSRNTSFLVFGCCFVFGSCFLQLNKRACPEKNSAHFSVQAL